MNTLERARSIQQTLGTSQAARFLQRRGWGIEAALRVLMAGPKRKGTKK